jgi:hypothetical protein
MSRQRNIANNKLDREPITYGYGMHLPVEVHGGVHRLGELPLLLDGADLVVGEPERLEEELQQLVREGAHLLVELLHHVTVPHTGNQSI